MQTIKYIGRRPRYFCTSNVWFNTSWYIWAYSKSACDNQNCDNEQLDEQLLNAQKKSIERIYHSLLANSWQQQVMNNKPIWVGYNIWVLAEAYVYVVQFEPYQSVQKGKQVASTSNWGLGENFVLWLMIIWITISHLFVSLPTLELTTFAQQWK